MKAMEMKKGDLCLVTGVSGYLASWLAKDLLEQGFTVRGTVRSLQDENRAATLRALLPGIQLVAADLRSAQGWAEAVAGVKWVFHVASPQAVKSETGRTAVAVSGMRYVLGAAFASDSVCKIVVTSSEAAIAYGHPRSKRHFNEDDWTELSAIKGGDGADYFRSKTEAERLAWDWAQDPVRNPRRIPLSTINPSLILGPSLVPWGRFSVDTLRNIAEGKMPLMPDMGVHVVDVRDCAKMHIALMQDPAANARRHMSLATTSRMVDLARVIRHEYADAGFTPSTRLAPHWMMSLMHWVSADLASIYSHLGNHLHYEPQHPEVYEYQYHDLTEIVRNTMDSMLEHGWLTPRKPGHPTPRSA
ncbi:NAD-dependent epimerase/dehydratase family protein [Undibacterium sp.]|uniref:NAD-dependent epimerase/dehydratase family protein n=1 Tax=Undibacterium sp. TaxID=1914977 RepID=UPI00374CF41A